MIAREAAIRDVEAMLERQEMCKRSEGGQKS